MILTSRMDTHMSWIVFSGTSAAGCMRRSGAPPRVERGCFPMPRGFPSAALLVLCWFLAAHVALASDETPLPSGLGFIVGTWTGTSTCVGDGPACRNETVVYRFMPVDGHPRQARLLADKIIEGKRLPMGALVCDVDGQHQTLRCEFTVGHTHGVWSYAVTGDSMTGKLVILPEEVIGRDVAVHRASDGDLPPAPSPGDYEK